MSWSFRTAGRPADIVARVIAQTTTTNYTRPVGDQRNLDLVIARLTEDATYMDNGVPYIILEAEGSGHWDDVYGVGSYTYTLRVFKDRR